MAAAMAAESAGQDHGAVGQVLRRAFLQNRRQVMRENQRGDRIAVRLSAGVDTIIRTLFKCAPEGGGDIAVCAVGGFGRSELAPFSDVDLLFLHGSQDEEALRDHLNRLLYPLWDSGIKLGYGVHTPSSAVAFAKDDMVARTAYLDIRFLCGAKALYEEFAGAYDKLRRKTIPEFVAAKLEEQRERQAASFETRYLVEPDIKEGKGGLRDLQTIHWLYKFAFADRRAIEKIMEPSARKALAKAGRFLWSVRAHLHDYRGRADENLTFDIQPEIADRLGYADRKDMMAAERLMKHYFVNAAEIGRLTRILCARLEEERSMRLPRMPKMLPRALSHDEAPGKPNLRIHNGRLDFDSAARAERQPRDFFRLFRAYGKAPKFDFHPNALAVVSEQTPKVTQKVRIDPVVAKLFAGILTDSVDPERVLRIMGEAGLLGKYLPPFGEITGRIDYGLYRRFTLDESVLRCLGLLCALRRGDLVKDHPIATRILQDAENPLIFFIAVLLHETSWSLKDKSAAACEKLVTRVARRLGLDPEEASLVGWSAARYLMLVRTAERRNLTESHAISLFARSVGSQARLDLMLVISVCHLRVVGVQTWDELIRHRLAALYEASSLWVADGEYALEMQYDVRALEMRQEARARLTKWSEKDKTAFLDRLDDFALRSLDPDLIVRFATLMRAAEKDNAPAAVVATPQSSGLEAVVVAADRPGLLADLAGAIASTGLSVRNLKALTTSDGKAIDIFIVQPPDGVSAHDVDQARRLHRALLDAATTVPEKAPRLRRRIGDRRDIFAVKPHVRLEFAASNEAMVVETEGLDRPGLLFEMTQAIAEEGAIITAAHIATYGERAVDVFYLTDSNGEKLVDPVALARIEKALMGVLSSDADE